MARLSLKKIILVMCLTVVAGSIFVIKFNSVENAEHLSLSATQQASATSQSQHWEKISFGSSINEWLLLYRFDPTKEQLLFAHSGEPKSIEEWYTELNASFVINGVYFHDDHLPSGFLTINSQQIGQRNFDVSRSAIFSADTQNIIEDLESTTQLRSHQNAAQSYPVLIRDGKNAVIQDSEQRARRTFIGTDVHGMVYAGVIPDTQVSLFELAHILENLEIKWDRVLNLDGGTSTGLFSKEHNIHSILPVPNVLYSTSTDS